MSIHCSTLRPSLRRASSDCSLHALPSHSWEVPRHEKNMDSICIPWGVLTAPEMPLPERLLTTQPGAEAGPCPLCVHVCFFILDSA